MATLQEAIQMVDLYLQAERNVLEGKTVTLAGKSYTYENLSEIRSGRQEWERVKTRLSSNRRGPKFSRIIPQDI
jgi:hypothetical protein